MLPEQDYILKNYSYKKRILPKEELIRNLDNYRNGSDPEAGNRVFLSGVNFAVKEAIKFKIETNSYTKLNDLVQEAYIGLVKGMKKYKKDKINPRTGEPYSFISYSVHWIRAYMRLYEIKERGYTGLIKDSSNEKIKIKTYNFRNKPHVISSDKNNGKMIYVPHLSLDAEPNNNNQFYDSIPSKSSPVREVENKSLLESLNCIVDSLSPREQQVIRLRYLNNKKESLRDIGIKLGVSPEAVRLNEKKAMEKLKIKAKKLQLDEYINN